MRAWIVSGRQKQIFFNQVVEEEVLLLQICEGNKLKAHEPQLMETMVVTTWLFHFLLLSDVCLSVCLSPAGFC